MDGDAPAPMGGARKVARIAQVKIALELLQELMTAGNGLCGVECVEGLPEGADFLYFITRGYGRHGDLGMVFQHDSFEDVQPGEVIPILTPAFVRHYQAETEE